ncbi:hypothetical protein GTQ34_09475 [Muricauda sp. JGD-17]|uniref:Tetratricopeptide repeat protein n=1 Tax=Flagellimonas ochracea TaxID=2696472 RepID=A0A964TC44_9FLAO|nr:hypothetical protein [Allomuricauda ochracea]NAY92149.1 hypothetical protein [Allomuricauda ochracea]
MNVSDFLHLLHKSNTILSPQQTRELEDILEEYPYFQAARALHLKGLKNLDSYKYNNALKLTAAHTTDRDVLFDYITSKEFLQNSIADTISGRTSKLEDQNAVSEEIEPNPETVTIQGGSGEALPQNIHDAEKILDPKLFGSKKSKTPDSTAGQSRADKKNNPSEDLQLGKPLPFTKKEKHSFTEWLQLTKTKKTPPSESTATDNLHKKQKFDLLDKFIENNPKIVPKENIKVQVNIKESTTIDTNELMTETLAKVYLEQKKYKKAIQAFKILRLKYPEKSGFFADQIRAVKKLQNEKD